MNKEDVKQAYRLARDSKLALDALLGSAPAEVRQAYRDKYTRDTGALYAVSDRGVPVSVLIRNKKTNKPARASRASQSNARYLAAVANIRTAMHRRGWSS